MWANLAVRGSSREVDAQASSRSGWRGPAALWLSPDGKTLVAACSKSGSLAVIDVAQRAVVQELPLGKSLVALAATADGRTLAVCDAGANELLILDRTERQFRVRHRVALPPNPSGVVMDATGESCLVSSNWSRQVSRIRLSDGSRIAALDLDFSPRNLLLLPDKRTAMVTDAFGGQTALVDLETFSIHRQLEIPGHNIRGVTVSPDGSHALISHMILTESAATTRDNVFWGIAMTSNVRVIPISALMDHEKHPIREGHTHFFGDPNNGAGDPEAIASLSDGTTVVCLGGVGEVAVGRYKPYAFRRVVVGRRPVDLAISPDERMVYVANAHSDTISVVDIKNQSVAGEIVLGATPKFTVAEEGERLFYDSRLALDGWFSCHSCHTDGHTNGQRADTFGDGSYGAPKEIMTLLGTGSTEPWAWNGTKPQLDHQIRESLRSTMQPKAPASERTVAAINAFLMTLEPPPVTKSQRRDAGAIERGREIFTRRGCVNCHAPPVYTNTHTYYVGIDDGEGGNRLFNPPSLRGVSHTAPYFHDGRAESLEEVFRKFRHRIRGELTDDELSDLITFLRSL